MTDTDGRPPTNWLRRQLASETTGGGLLLLAVLVALVAANSRWSGWYLQFTHAELGPTWCHMSVTAWCADGLLSVFFFVVGLELRHELTLGALSTRATAIAPIAAAVGGMVGAALIFVAINATSMHGELGGWTLPLSSDVAFSLAVLAVFGRTMPMHLRAVLLTIAVVNDLAAIIIIAVLYAGNVHLSWLVLAVGCVGVYALSQRRRIRAWWWFVPLVLVAWYCCWRSGISPTIIGVALGLCTRVRPDPGERQSPVDRLSDRLHPWSAGIVVPLFAFTAVGIDVRGTSLGSILSQPLALGIVLGFVIGQPLGVLCAAWVMHRLTGHQVAPVTDLLPIAMLCGIGLTVPLLLIQLRWADHADLAATAKVAVLCAAVIAAVASALLLTWRARSAHPVSAA